MTTKIYHSVFATTILIILVAGMIACNNSKENSEKSASAATMMSEKPDSSASQHGLNTDPSTVANSVAECLQDWKGCGYLGARQATYNVRPDGTWEFEVRYCCNYQRCYKTGTGAPTTTGSVRHAEYSLNATATCLELVSRQYF